MIEWLMERLSVEDSGKMHHQVANGTENLIDSNPPVEAIHIANLLCQHGYFFPVGECKNLLVKDDSSLYRFQVRPQTLVFVLPFPPGSNTYESLPA